MRHEKLWRTLFYILMGLPLVVTLAALLVLPAEIPVHYNAAGEVNRWGSKYEMLFLSLITLLMGAFLLKVSQWSGRKAPGNRTAVLAIGCGALLVFNVMTVVFLVQGLPHSGPGDRAGAVRQPDSVRRHGAAALLPGQRDAQAPAQRLVRGADGLDHGRLMRTGAGARLWTAGS